MSNDLLAKLGIQFDSPFLDEALEAVENTPVPEWLTQAYLEDLEREYQLFGSDADAIFAAARQVAKTPALCLFAKILHYIVGKRAGFSKSFPCLKLNAEIEESFVALFPVAAYVRASSDALRARGVPEDIVLDTLNFLRRNITESHEKLGKPGFTRYALSIYSVYLFTRFLWIGRLRFEIHTGFDRCVRAFANENNEVCTLMCDTMLHKGGNILGAIGCTDEEGAYDANFVETDTYYEGYPVDPETALAKSERVRLDKSQWRPILSPGDTLLKLHIPGGGPLDMDACQTAHKRAREVFKRCYPEYDFKGLVGNTWLFCPLLQKVLREDSNTVRYQKLYHLFPSKNDASTVFLYVFDMEVKSADEVDAAALPENNSMQRGVKKLLLEGNYLHQFNGFIPYL